MLFLIQAAALFILLGNASVQAQSNEALTQLPTEKLIEQVSPSVVLILVGQGGGRLSGLGSGVIIRSDGIVLTSYHVVKNAAEVQVRLKNGDIYDRVVLIGVDERRDVVALRIPVRELPAISLERTDQPRVGESVFVVSHPGALPWTASSGILSASRMADEVPGAGNGFRLLQFTAPVSPGSSGGALVDEQGRALGIVAGSLQGQNLNFAIPIESVTGLADLTGQTNLGSGSGLRLPQPDRPPGTDAVVNTKVADAVLVAKTAIIQSRSSFFPVEPVEKELLKNPVFHYRLVTDPRVADLIIQLDRPLFTWDFTFNVTLRQTSVVVAAGKVIAWDGVRAASSIAKQITQQLIAKSRDSQTGQKKP